MSRKKLSRRDFLRISAMGAAGGLLAACTPEVVTKTVKETVESQVEVTKVVTEKEEVEVTREVPAEQVEVTVLMYGGLLSQADAFTEGVLYTVHLMDYNLRDGRQATVRYEALPGGDDYNTKIRLMAQSGELDDHVVWGNWNPVYNYAIDEILMPLDDLMDSAGVTLDEWTEGAQSLMTYDPNTKMPGSGPVWGLPQFAIPGVCFLFTNVDMLEAAGVDGVPTSDSTLVEVTEMAEQVSNYAEGIFGMSALRYGGAYDMNNCHDYASPFGGRVLNPEGTECLIDSDECLEAFQWYYDLVHNRHINPNPDESEAMGHRGGCAEGKLAMYRQGPWGAGWFINREENVDPQVAYPLFPTSFDGRPEGRRGNQLGIDWHGVAKDASHPEACFDVLYWLTGYEAATFVVEAGRTSPMPRVDALTDPMLEEYPFIQAVSQATANAEPPVRAANLRGGEVDDLIAQRFGPVATGETQPDEGFLAQLAEEIQDILDMPPV